MELLHLYSLNLYPKSVKANACYNDFMAKPVIHHQQEFYTDVSKLLNPPPPPPPNPTLPPATPTGLTLQSGDAQLIATWNAVVGATSYVLRRRPNNNAVWTVVYSGVETSYTDTTGLVNGVSQTYQVRAIKTGATPPESAFSASVTGTPQAPATSGRTVDVWWDLAQAGTPPGASASADIAWAKQSANAAKLNALPFDGYVLCNHSYSWGSDIHNGSRVVTQGELFNAINIPLLTKKKAFFFTMGNSGNFLDPENLTARSNYIASMGNLFAAMKQAGYTMLAMDNEYGDLRGLRESRWAGRNATNLLNAFYATGQGVGQAINNNFPELKWFQWHGPYMGLTTETRANTLRPPNPKAVPPNNTLPASQYPTAQYSYVFGYEWDPGAEWSMEPSTRFFVGVLKGRNLSQGKRMISGGQFYTAYDPDDFPTGAAWIRNGIQNRSYIPSDVRVDWTAKISAGGMSYPCYFKDISPSVFEGQFESHVKNADSDCMVYFSPGDVSPGINFWNWAMNGTRDIWCDKIVNVLNRNPR